MAPTSNLHQIQVQFVPVEDRLLLRIQTRDRAEFRFWLTRRFVKALWPALVRILASDQTVRAQSGPEARQAVLSFQHASAIERSDFQTQYRQGVAATPLGDTPILLCKLSLKERTGHPVLCLHPAQGRGIELTLAGTMLHSLCHLLADTATKAGWDLSLQVGAREETPRPSSPRSLN